MSDTSATGLDTEEMAEEEIRAVHHVPGERSCLACGDKFQSEGWHNRLCLRCRKRSAADYY